MPFEFINIYITSLLFFVFIFFNFKKIKTNTLINKSETCCSPRVYFFDFIKGVSIIGVILIHVAYFYYDFDKYETFSFYQNYIIKIFRYSVPFFLISSGFLLDLKNFSLKEIFKFYYKKFFRLFIPYLIFCILFFIFKNNNFNIIKFIGEFFNGNISKPYYFISILFQLYIIYPLILFLFNKFSNLKILIFSFLISFLGPLFLLNGINLFIPYLIYFIFGIYIKKNIENTNLLEILKSKNFIIFNTFIVVLYFLLSIVGPSEKYSNFQFAYSMSLFLLFFVNKERIENKYKLLQIIGKNSFYIFLIHFELMNLIYIFLQNKYDLKIEFIIFVIVTFMSCGAILFIQNTITNKIKKHI